MSTSKNDFVFVFTETDEVYSHFSFDNTKMIAQNMKLKQKGGVVLGEDHLEKMTSCVSDLSIICIL